MKIGDYASFHFQLGRLDGIAAVNKDEAVRTSLMEIVRELKALLANLFRQEKPAEKSGESNLAVLPPKKTLVGSVLRPKAEELNKTPAKKAEEKAVEEAFEEIIPGSSKIFDNG
jgi:DNA topoisomerase VI subunit B